MNIRSYLTGPYTFSSSIAFAAVVLGATAVDAGRSHAIARTWARGILGVADVSLDVEGRENLIDGPVVVMANHQSYIDVPILMLGLPYDLNFVAKKQLSYIPMFGWGMKAMGHVFVDRGNTEAAIRTLDEAADQIRAGTNVGVFPEGTRSKTGELLRFKKGGFVLAIKSGVPILPVSIDGSRDLLPVGAKRILPGRVTVRVHPAVDTSAIPLEAKDALVEQVQSIIAGGLSA